MDISTISIEIPITTQTTISYTQTPESIIFKDSVREKEIHYKYIELINRMKENPKNIPSSYKFDCEKNIYRFFVKPLLTDKNIQKGYIICDMCLNLYIFISIEEIIKKINFICDEEKLKKRKEYFEEKIQKGKEAYNNMIWLINYSRDIFYKEVYTLETEKSSYILSASFRDLGDLEVYDKWGLYSKHCIFDKNELYDEMEKNNEDFEIVKKKSKMINY